MALQFFAHPSNSWSTHWEAVVPSGKGNATQGRAVMGNDYGVFGIFNRM